MQENYFLEFTKMEEQELQNIDGGQSSWQQNVGELGEQLQQVQPLVLRLGALSEHLLVRIMA